jgi:oligoribonuclease NrnB/cAMP/cGMP phosphodiesterase (DHH superfamily)
MSSMLVSTIGADMSATFSEKVDEDGQPAVECSFRAKPGFNVSDLAFELGGGGHPPASGCTVSGSLAEVSERVVGLMKSTSSPGKQQVGATLLATSSRNQTGDLAVGCGRLNLPGRAFLRSDCGFA